MKKRLPVILLSALLSAFVAFQVIFTVPERPLLIFGQGSNWRVSDNCESSHSAKALDNDGKLNLLVWNIYKQSRDNWQPVLNKLSLGVQLVLLQEASQTDALGLWSEQGSWYSDAVQAFSVLGHSAGVANFSSVAAQERCPSAIKEPWIRLPKSGLYALYPLSDGRRLAVINLHGVNFAFGVSDYADQLAMLTAFVAGHQGPLILAGDFNSWSEARMRVLNQVARKLGLRPVEFNPDQRSRFINGLPLDHIFYRGLVLMEAEANETNASDHSPLQANFLLSLPSVTSGQND